MNFFLFQRFFGIIRQNSGNDTHPTVVQFLYLYRLMSVYALVKSPKYGCVEYDQFSILIRMKELASKNKEQHKTILQQLQQQLEVIFNEPSEQNAAIIDETIAVEHDYADTDVISCILYTLGGFIARRLSAVFTIYINNSLLNKSPLLPCSLLTDIKSNGGLLYPTS